MATKLGQLFGVGISPTEVIGIRIQMVVLIDTLPGSGRTEERDVSVTVNALASDTLADVRARAEAFVNSGNLGSRRGVPMPATVLEDDVQQVYFGGYDDPTIRMA